MNQLFIYYRTTPFPIKILLHKKTKEFSFIKAEESFNCIVELLYFAKLEFRISEFRHFFSLPEIQFGLFFILHHINEYIHDVQCPAIHNCSHSLVVSVMQIILLLFTTQTTADTITNNRNTSPHYNALHLIAHQSPVDKYIPQFREFPQLYGRLLCCIHKHFEHFKPQHSN